MKLIILDRDGVINEDSSHFIKSSKEWAPIPGSLEAIASLNKAGFTVAIASNQSGIARGIFKLKDLEAIHLKMQEALALLGGTIAKIVYCPHESSNNCNCRKPKPGLFYQIANHFSVDLKQHSIPCVGDSLRDLEGAETAGGKPILVQTGNGLETEKKLPWRFKNILRFKNLASAADFFIENT